MRDILYLEDLTVGQRFTTGDYALDEAAIIAFGKAFDPQPFHTDSDAARQTFFGGLAASGWHTAAITMRLQAQSGPYLACGPVGPDGMKGGMIGAGGEIAWPRPTRPGDILHVESEILEVTPSRSRPERGFATLRSETRNQHDAVLQTLRVKLMVWRRPT